MFHCSGKSEIWKKVNCKVHNCEKKSLKFWMKIFAEFTQLWNLASLWKRNWKSLRNLNVWIYSNSKPKMLNFFAYFFLKKCFKVKMWKITQTLKCWKRNQNVFTQMFHNKNITPYKKNCLILSQIKGLCFFKHFLFSCGK